MKLAAIDIGSNAVRMQITKVIEYHQQVTFKKLEYVRFPLRLGHDVFSTGKISSFNQDRFFKLMSAYKNLIDLYEIDDYMGCATSAMRESENGNEIIDKVKQEIDLDVNIISGDEEAELINKVIIQSLDNENYIHIDVGGGSTELNIYKKKAKTKSSSFPLGSVRSLEHSDKPEVWEEMKNWIYENIKDKKTKVRAIGTGGNINKLFELAQQKSTTDRKMSLESLMKTQDILKNLSLDDRLFKLQLNPDRADVIIPASTIYIEVMKSSGAKKMLVPDVGLKDGINYFLYQKAHPNSEKIFVRN